MKTKEQLQNELDALKQALKNGAVTTNEYQSAYYNISQQLKKINNQ